MIFFIPNRGLDLPFVSQKCVTAQQWGPRELPVLCLPILTKKVSCLLYSIIKSYISFHSVSMSPKKKSKFILSCGTFWLRRGTRGMKVQGTLHSSSSLPLRAAFRKGNCWESFGGSCRNKITFLFSRRLRIRHWEKNQQDLQQNAPFCFQALALLNRLKGRGFSCFPLETWKRLTKKRTSFKNAITASLALAENNSLMLLQSPSQGASHFSLRRDTPPAMKWA